MFLTLSPAWKLWAMAFCGWILIASAGQTSANLDSPDQDPVPVPTAAAPKAPTSASKTQWAKRPDAEAPPAPPAPQTNTSKPSASTAGSVPSQKAPSEKAPAAKVDAGSVPVPVQDADAGSVPAQDAGERLINTSVINPAESKSFVVQASGTQELPPPPQVAEPELLAAPPAATPAKPATPPKPQAPTRVTKDHTQTTPTPSANASSAPSPASPTKPSAKPSPNPTDASPKPTAAEPTAAEPTASEPAVESQNSSITLTSPDVSAPDSATPDTPSAAPTPAPRPTAPRKVNASNQPNATRSSDASVKSGTSVARMHIGDQSGAATRKPSSTKLSLASGSIEELPAATHRVLESIEFDDTPLSEAMKLFSEQSGLNVITSAEAGKAKVTVYLKDVTALDALEAIVKANGLFYRIEAASGIVRIATSNEYEKDLSSFREEQTRVFTLLYPNPIAVAQVIQQVFGNRVQMNRADADVDDLVDLSRRFNRFDMVDGRSLGLGSPNNSGAGGGSNSFALGNRGGFGGGMNGGLNNNMNGGLGGMASGMGASGGIGGLPGMNGNYPTAQYGQNANQQRDHALLNNLSAGEIQQIENQVAQQGQLDEQSQANLLQRRDATIYISTIRRNNQVIVRTGDNRSMDQIAQLIAQLDVPTPTVLLEVKVLRVVLADGFNSAFEYFGASGNASTAMSDGTLAPAFPGASTVARSLGAGLGVSGGVPGSLTFQMVDDKFRVRMQLLESKNCVTALATPLILTANNEVSRIFVGDTLPFTVGFTPSQLLSSVSAVNGAVAATPITELRDVGQSLLITPNINADRTVTLRVIEENSERVLSGSSIPVPATSGTGVTNVNVDTVRRRTISGTIVAQDGMAVALGGLIEEQVSDSRDQVPVLGNIPGLGLLFRRQASGRSRSELVVIVRPYVFNTPTESAATTEMLLGELSTHPNSPDAMGTMNALPCKVTRSETESSQRAKLFQLHNRSMTAN